MSSPVLIGATIYGLTLRSKGQFVAIDATSGKTLWNTQGREGENAYWQPFVAARLNNGRQRETLAGAPSC